MSVFSIDNCPVCDNQNWKTFLTCTDFYFSHESFEILKCDNCGFKITGDAADEENIDRYYGSEEYISHSNTTKGFVNKVYHRVRSYMLGRKRILTEKVTNRKTGNILDIGAGTGYFLNEMKKHGWTVAGTEKSNDAVNFAGREFDIVIQNPEKLFSFDEESFDAVTLWHVLEHIHRLDENMEAFYKVLAPGGKLIIALPNHTSYDARHYKEYWAAWDVPRHLWHFAPEHIKQFAEKHGFKQESVHTMPFDSFYVSMLSEKYKKSKCGLIKGFMHGTISWITSTFSKNRCSSLIYVFGK